MGRAAAKVEEGHRLTPFPGEDIQHHAVARVGILLAFRPAHAEVAIAMALEEALGEADKGLVRPVTHALNSRNPLTQWGRGQRYAGAMGLHRTLPPDKRESMTS